MVGFGDPERRGEVTMGAPKIKCPGCGAKNDAMTRRCRVCAGLINMNVPEPGKGGVEDKTAMPEQTFFDANDINQQLRPKAQMFKTAGGGLGARLAAAKGGGAPAGPAPPPADSWPTVPAPANDSWDGGGSFAETSFGPPPSPAADSYGPSFGPEVSGPTFEPQAFEPQSFEPQAFNSSSVPDEEPFVAQDFSRDETFTPQEFTVSKPDLPPLGADDETFDPNAFFREEPGAF
jgi:hypothetical protein